MIRAGLGLFSLALAAVAVVLAGWNGDTTGWEQVSSMSQRRSYLAAAEVGGQVYVAGGMVGETGRPLATFARYEPGADRWVVLPQLPVPTRAAAAAAVDGVVYVTGGTTDEGNTASTWAYDTGSGRWSERAPLPAPRFNHAAVADDGSVYVLGGYLEGTERREVFAYDPEADRWRLVTRLPVAMHAFGAVGYRDEIWALGGRRGERILRDVWIFDPGASTWRKGPTMPEPMELLGATVDGDDIHAVWESTYQVYDGADGSWHDGPQPLVTRHALEAFAIDGALYAIGGCTTALRDSPVVERLRLE